MLFYKLDINKMKYITCVVSYLSAQNYYHVRQKKVFIFNKFVLPEWGFEFFKFVPE